MQRAKIVKIGNSQGIRIPQPLLHQAGLKGSVKLRAEKGRLVVIPDDEPRAGWSEAFAKAVEKSGGDGSAENWPANEFDKQEWTW
jgi:antitoxin MazE